MLRLGDGSVVWRSTVGGDDPVMAGCAFTGSHVYAVTSGGTLAVLDAANGAVMESHALNATPGLEGFCLSSPLVAGGRVYVGSETGGVRCYAGRRVAE